MNERLEKGKVWLKEHWKDVLRVALVLAIVLVIVFHYEDLEDLDVRGLVEMAPSVWLAALIAILIYAVKGAVMVIPASLVYLSIGVAFETWQAIIINIVGIFVELSVSYLVGRFVGGERVEKLLAKKTESGSGAGRQVQCNRSGNLCPALFQLADRHCIHVLRVYGIFLSALPLLECLRRAPAGHLHDRPRRCRL
ncbi:MAG TPA: hypothetical protein PLS28_02400 [Clostridiales bacterium]|nr:hypothetical protein [Clostridiales bacterium]